MLVLFWTYLQLKRQKQSVRNHLRRHRGISTIASSQPTAGDSHNFATCHFLIVLLSHISLYL